MKTSKCCGAKIRLIDCYKDPICSVCGKYSKLSISTEQDKPSIEVIEMPEMTEEWREKIIFIKEKT